MPPKRAEVLGDVTPRDSSPASGADDKKKNDTTPTPVVDKDVTPSEDDKKKKDSSTSGKKGTSSQSIGSTSRGTQHTELTEIEGSPGRRRLAGKRKDQASRAPGKLRGEAGTKKRIRNQQKTFLKKMKHLRKVQSKHHKSKRHPRSMASAINHILRSVNETQETEGLHTKRVNTLAMNIFDSFANDLSDRVINTAVELVRTTGKRQLGSNEVKAAMKLVLPFDMAACAEEAVQASLMTYKENTRKYQGKIDEAKDNKKAAKAT